MLKQLLPKEHMQHIKSVTSWEEAIAIASKPLLQKGIIDSLYIDKMIESVQENGPYIVLMDYFALPHAKAGIGVHEVGMALLVLDEPIDLKGNPVKVFLVLAAIDANSHIQALAEISEILVDQKNYQTFISGDVTKIHNLF